MLCEPPTTFGGGVTSALLSSLTQIPARQHVFSRQPIFIFVLGRPGQFNSGCVEPLGTGNAGALARKPMSMLNAGEGAGVRCAVNLK